MTSRTLQHPSQLTDLGKTLRALDWTQPWVVTWQPESEVRTAKQNRRYWGALVRAFCEWLAMPEGGGRTVSKELAHAYLKMEILGGQADVIAGKVVTAERHSRTLTKAQFADYVDRCEAHLIELGVPAEMIAGFAVESGEEGT